MEFMMRIARRIRRIAFCPAFFLFILLAFGPGIGLGLAQTQAQVDLASKRVLILHSFAHAQPVYKIIDQSLEDSFVSSGLNFNNLYFEFLDMARNPGQEYRNELVDIFRQKYQRRKFDLAVAVHQQSLDFLLKEGQDFYPEGPIIQILGDPIAPEHSDSKRPLIYFPFSIDAVSTVKSVFALRPDTQKIVVIAGSLPVDRRFLDFVQGDLKAWKGDLEAEYLPPLPMDEILRRVAQLPPRTAILYTNVAADSTGKTYMPRDAARMISRSANAPVFGLYETLLGDNGVVGGIMLNHRLEGERAVRVAGEILRGMLPQKPLTILQAPLTPMFDWRQLERWGLKASALPPDAIILNKPVSFWEHYKLYIVVGLVFLLAQSFLIAGLLVQRRRKRTAEESLRQKTEEMDQFFDLSLELLSVANTDGYFLRLNPAWERSLGYSREELMAKQFLEFVHPDDLVRTQDAVSTLASQQKVISFENRYRCKDGTHRWLDWAAVPAGNLIYAAARDITERLKIEVEARQRREELAHVTRVAMIGELTTSLAHEINQPLTAILSNAEAAQRFLSQASPDIGEVRQILEDIIRDDRRANEVVRRVWTLVKKEKVRDEPLDLNEVILAVIDLLRADSLLQDLSIAPDLSPRLAMIHGDGIQLQQVILNLILNGAAAMRNSPPGQRKIVVRTAMPDSRTVKAFVTDFGTGIDERHVDRLFEPFYTTKPEGLGMGLSISQKIIKAHGGIMEARNNREGGATFAFSLPAE
jgi:PAS domain S-box-containing protein